MRRQQDRHSFVLFFLKNRVFGGVVRKNDGKNEENGKQKREKSDKNKLEGE